MLKNARFNGVELVVERDYEIDNKRAGFVLLDKNSGQPVLIIETKRKYVKAGSFRTDPKFNPLSSAVIGQAFCYAALAKRAYGMSSTPLFATANPSGMAVFAPVEDPESFVDINACLESRYDHALKPGKYNELIERYRLEIVKITEGDIQAIIEKAVKLWLKLVKPKDVQVGLGNWFIEHLRVGFVDVLIDTYGVADYLRNELVNDSGYYQRLDKLAREKRL